MYNKLLVALVLIVGQVMAMEPMELSLPSKQTTPTDITEKEGSIIIEEQKIGLPARHIILIGTLKNHTDIANLPTSNEFLKEGIPLPKVTLDTWQHIESQLERVYKKSKGDNQSKDEIIVDYSQLDNMTLINLLRAVEYLDIPLLTEITLELLELAEDKLTFDEILMLPAYRRNEVIKRRALKIACPVVLKELAVWRGLKEWSDTSICITQDNKIVLGDVSNSSPHYGILCIWDMTGKELVVCRGHKGRVRSVCVTRDNKIVSGSWDGTVRIWDINGNQLAIWDINGKKSRGYRTGVNSVCVTRDNKIVSGSTHGIVQVWDMNGNQLAEFRGHEWWISSVCVTSDNRIVSGAHDKTVRVWDMSGKELAVCRGHEDTVESVCVTSDNKIVSGAADNTVRIWDMSGNLLAVCRGHEGSFDRVTSVCLTSDNRIVSGSTDGAVRIWDTNGQQQAVCQGHKNDVRAVCVTRDNKIVSGSWDGTVQIWDRSDITLHDRLSGMSENQAEAVCQILQSTIDENIKKEQSWKEIAKIFEEEEELPILSKWRYAGGLKLLILPASFLIALWFLDFWKAQEQKEQC